MFPYNTKVPVVEQQRLRNNATSVEWRKVTVRCLCAVDAKCTRIAAERIRRQTGMITS